MQIQFESDKYWDEDTLWNLSIVSVCDSIILVDNLWYAYVMNPNSMTHEYRGDRVYEFQYRANQEYERIKKLWPDCIQAYYHWVWRGFINYCRTDPFHIDNPKRKKERYKNFYKAIDFPKFYETIHNIDFSNDKRKIFRVAKELLRYLLIYHKKIAYNYFAVCIKYLPN